MAASKDILAPAETGTSPLRDPYRAELEAIYDHAPIMMGLMDQQRQLRFVNREMALFIGKPASDITGGTACGALGCVNALDDPRGCGFGPKCKQCPLLEAITDTFATGDSHRNIECEMPVQRGDLLERVTLLASTARIDTLDASPVLLCLQNISLLKRAEKELLAKTEERRKLDLQIQQTQKLESLGVLAGGIAHDFNNILMSILGNAELALDDISPLSPASDGLRRILLATRRAAELCRQMLAYSGQTPLAPTRINLRELIEQMAHLLKSAISKKAILKLHADDGLPQILADPTQVRQILMNLIVNASEAIGDRSGVVSVSLGLARCHAADLRRFTMNEDLKPGDYVCIEVADTGCGIKAQTQQRIFEPFFTTKATGRGLGLAAVLGIMRQHQGALTVDSEVGQGTTFKVIFPALEHDATPHSAANSVAPTPWRGSGTVLVVDDEESLRNLCGRMLESMGLTVLMAGDGREAVERYRVAGARINLVILDLTMPHMDGKQSFTELRRLNPNVKVVLASGYNEEDIAARFEGKGLVGVLQKPYSIQKLRDLLQSTL